MRLVLDSNDALIDVFGGQVLSLVFNYSMYGILWISLLLIRKVKDQHFIWKEVTFASIWLVINISVPGTGMCRSPHPL